MVLHLDVDIVKILKQIYTHWRSDLGKHGKDKEVFSNLDPFEHPNDFLSYTRNLNQVCEYIFNNSWTLESKDAKEFSFSNERMFLVPVHVIRRLSAMFRTSYSDVLGSNRGHLLINLMRGIIKFLKAFLIHYPERNMPETSIMHLPHFVTMTLERYVRRIEFNLSEPKKPDLSFGLWHVACDSMMKMATELEETIEICGQIPELRVFFTSNEEIVKKLRNTVIYLKQEFSVRHFRLTTRLEFLQNKRSHGTMMSLIDPHPNIRNLRFMIKKNVADDLVQFRNAKNTHRIVELLNCVRTNNPWFPSVVEQQNQGRQPGPSVFIFDIDALFPINTVSAQQALIEPVHVVRSIKQPITAYLFPNGKGKIQRFDNIDNVRRSLRPDSVPKIRTLEQRYEQLRKNRDLIEGQLNGRTRALKAINGAISDRFRLFAAFIQRLSTYKSTNGNPPTLVLVGKRSIPHIMVSACLLKLEPFFPFNMIYSFEAQKEMAIQRLLKRFSAARYITMFLGEGTCFEISSLKLDKQLEEEYLRNTNIHTIGPYENVQDIIAIGSTYL
ncbi:hypothetical protein PCE1_001335 [Barthelona sp. PCE]